ncbi:MAG: phosphate ABC transporter substrate-binding protein [Planctomycetaceae bacterium]
MSFRSFDSRGILAARHAVAIVGASLSLVAVVTLAGCDAGPRTTTPGGGAQVQPAGTNGQSDGMAVTVDPELPVYAPVQGVSGTITSVGSDTMNNLMTLWAEGFQKHYPGVKVEVEGKGTSTAMPALVAGTSNFGPMSRPAKGDEVNAFQQKFGYKPELLSTAVDMLAVYVHKDNPLTGLTLTQVDAIFSKNRVLGHDDDVTTWGQLGLTGEWADKPISLYGRNSASGTYGFFKDVALGGGDFKDTVKEQPGSSSVVQSVSQERYGIGYSGIGYITSNVKAVPLAQRDGDDFVPPAANSGDRYPLYRFLYLAVNKEPNKALDPLRQEFVRFIFSRDGQDVVIKDGYLPINAAQARVELEKLGIEPGF